MTPVAPHRRRGNAVIVIVILVAIVGAAAIAIIVGERGAAIQQDRYDPNMPIRTLDTLLRPVAEWAAAGIVDETKNDGGKLPDDAEGAKIIAGMKDRPAIEGAANFTATPVYRRMGDKNFEIVLASAELDGSAHLVYPFTADGRLLAPVADNVFLQSTEVERDGLVAEPGAGTTPR